MAAHHPSTPPTFAPSGASQAPDSVFDASSLEHMLGQRLQPARWIGWRLRLLLAAALLGCLGLFLLIRTLADIPHVDAVWRATAQAHLELVSSRDPRLQALEGRSLLGIAGADGSVLTVDALALQRAPRWLVSDEQRDRHAALQDQLAKLFAQREVTLFFHDGATVSVPPRPRGAGGLGTLFWLLGALALLLYLIAWVVLLARPSQRNLIYALMALAQAGNVLFIAVESAPGLGMPVGFARADLMARIGFDLLTGAALVHATAIHPRRLPGWPWWSAAVWASALAIAGFALAGRLPHLWWTTQAATIGYGMAAIVLLSWSYRLEPNPFAIVLRRFGFVGLGTLILLTLAVAVAERQPGLQLNIATVGSVIWYVFLASLLLLVPFLSRSQQVMREFSMLAGISTVATSLDLLFVAVFSLGQFASLTLSLFLSLGLYAGARQWILNQMLGNNMLTTERMFELLYRIAREVEARPQRAGELLSRLLRELFEPLEVMRIERPLRQARVVGDGSTMLVPVPPLADEEGTPQGSVVLRFAHRGKRMFTHEDARLTDRIVEQLRRAVAFDKAIEQARSEERARIAQDLHDDIGARLLTLMYKAPNPEMEDYVRHTLQDLKTLTRGLAASSHPLSHAAAEWKADITQRLGAAQCDLRWSFTCDREIVLTVVQWSALTRILRELVSNTISHSQASQVQVDIGLEREVFTLRVCDDGVGRDPSSWSHGLGLGGVRKRVKLLGGEVEWRENQPRGICCAVRVRKLS
ncbi:MAG: ATP-binding protein [Pseudomonadota bacterium]